MAGRLREQLQVREQEAAEARDGRVASERAAADSRTASAQVAAELAAVNRFLESAPATLGGAKSLADELEVDPGYEVALAAALGSLLRAGLVPDIAGRHEVTQYPPAAVLPIYLGIPGIDPICHGERR